jgi:cytochrome c oxidase subunit 3
MSTNPLEHRDDVGARMGMWLFLFSEFLIFGTFFIIYGVYRLNYGDDFREASTHLNRVLGSINTVVLLLSSLTMGMGTVSVKKGKVKVAVFWIIVTMILATCFLVNKSFEWSAKIDHGIFLNAPELLAMPKGEILFFGLYWLMTGLHAFHIFAGIILLGVMAWMVAKQSIRKDDHVVLENSALYWHVVDLLWGFLFPIFYLVI